MVAKTCLGFDYAARHIGVAVGQTLTGTATPLETIDNPRGGVDWARIDALIAEWRPEALVVGIPLTVDGKVQPTTRAARSFSGKLSERHRLPVHHVDERYTSRAAADRFREQRRSGDLRRKDHRRSDAVAAQLILEQWFAEQSSSG